MRKSDWKELLDKIISNFTTGSERKSLTERGRERESEREREKQKIPLSAVDAVVVEGGVPQGEPWKPLVADITATERHYSRSVKIRKAIYAFMLQNVGQPFSSWEDLQGAASLAAGCGMETARRWLITFSSANADFAITEQSVGLIIWKRGDDMK